MKNFFKNYLIFTTSIILILIVFISCKKNDVYKNLVYKYEVTGSGSNYLITIINSDNMEQAGGGYSSGWNYTWMQASPRFLKITAKNESAGGTVIVKIYKDNVVVAENTNSGANSIATVEGTY